jgi:hypothetical protein
MCAWKSCYHRQEPSVWVTYLTAHPPFSTTVKMAQIYGSFPIRGLSTVENSLPYFYVSSTPCLRPIYLVYLQSPPRVDDGCQDVYLPLPFYLPSTSLPPFYISSTSLPPFYLLSTSRLPLPLSTSRLSHRVFVYHTWHRTQSRFLLRYDNRYRMNYVYQLTTGLAN